MVGYHDFEVASGQPELNMTHLDLSYAYNDNLSFTASKVIDEGTDGSFDDDVLFQLVYSLDIE